MASVDIPPLIAGSGDLAVVYRTAAYLWGSWSATYPDGVTPPQMEPGRELGYVGDLRTDVTDLGSRCWTRADVQVDAVEHYSSAPEVFDAAEQRTAGEVFFEQDLEGPALGQLTPNVDFHVGDVVPVLVAGKLIDLPVTSITAVSRVGDEIGWQVHVGGQLVADERALEAENAGLERQILREARQFAREKGTDVLAAAKAFAETGDVAALEAAKSDAKAKADKALSDAKTYSEGLVKPVTTRLDQLGQDFKTQTGRVDTLTTSQEGTASKLQAVVNGDPGGLLTGTAFEKNQRAINELQAAFNAEQVGINTGFRKLFDGLEEADRLQQYLIRRQSIVSEATRARRARFTAEYEEWATGKVPSAATVDFPYIEPELTTPTVGGGGKKPRVYPRVETAGDGQWMYRFRIQIKKTGMVAADGRVITVDANNLLADGLLSGNLQFWTTSNPYTRGDYPVGRFTHFTLETSYLTGQVGRLELTSSPVWLPIPPEKIVKVRFTGSWVSYGLNVYAQQELEKLDKEFGF